MPLRMPSKYARNKIIGCCLEHAVYEYDFNKGAKTIVYGGLVTQVARHVAGVQLKIFLTPQTE